MRYTAFVPNARRTPQSQPVPGRESEMEKNRAGGYVFKADDWVRLRRFLILGSDTNAYYASDRELTRENLGVIDGLCRNDGTGVVEVIREISEERVAPTNDHALLALAYVSVHADEEGRKAAYAALPNIARIGTHLFNFLEYRKVLGGGWGRGIRNAVSSWYNDRRIDSLAYQMIKYRQRNGWTHADALRLAHPTPASKEHDQLFSWATGGDAENLPFQVQAYERIKDLTDDVERAVNLIRNASLPREAVPTELLNEVDVWAALLEDMPIGALVRNLGKMSSIGLISMGSDATTQVAEKLGNEDAIRKSGIHPVQILSALTTYSTGGGYRGNLSWTPNAMVLDALDGAFYMSFKNVKPTGKHILIGIDGSASMGAPASSQLPNLSASQAAAAMAMAVAHSEDDFLFTRFDTQAYPVDISKRMRLDDVVNRFQTGAATDCGATFTWARRNNIEVDAVLIYSDLMSWYGRQHPWQAAAQYRREINPNTRMVYAAFTSYGGQLNAPEDDLSLGVVGLDSSVPQLTSQFITGGF